MQTTACTKMLGCHLLEGAGHWVQQEQPEAVARLLVEFLKMQTQLPLTGGRRASASD
jgi:hypothetical protein